jgi:hypothetical protein
MSFASVAPNLANENETKDIEFSPVGFRRRWESGYEMTMRAIEHAPWTGDFHVTGKAMRSPLMPISASLLGTLMD